MIKRGLYSNLWQALSSEKQMIFVCGPRQVGKTTFAKEIAKTFKNQLYFNWDIIDNKKLLVENPAFFENLNRVDESMPLVILDEIHKYRHWKNYLKGIYDQFFQEYKFLVSGSGRLDIYQRKGDSLAGRYFMLHLFPFTIAESSERKKTFQEVIKSPLSGFDINDTNKTKKTWQLLHAVGGFPEPFVKQKKTFLTKWSRNYIRQVINEDIRNAFDIKKIDDIEILFSLLPSKVGNPLSLNNLANDIQVSFESIKNWINLFDRFYLTFRISPWTRKVARAIVKEKKLYLFNYPEIQNEGNRFENMVALELYRAISNWNDYGYGRFSLHYLRNKEKQEVDFLISDFNKPALLIETKFSDDLPAKSLVNFQKIFNIPAVQLVNKEDVFKYYKNGTNKILTVTAHRWLSSLP
ncbi:MAG: ATP-binding protein [Candidatus Omnitrophica bacterium]|nr:ATP-binding protein [Candidatus Omnitrophota bacterium]